MMELKVCIGSACHLKGSYDVIERLKALIDQSGAKDRIELKASFCLGRCGDGVTVKAGDDFLEGVTPATVDRIFAEQILPRAN